MIASIGNTIHDRCAPLGWLPEFFPGDDTAMRPRRKRAAPSLTPVQASVAATVAYHRGGGLPTPAGLIRDYRVNQRVAEQIADELLQVFAGVVR